MTHSQKRFAAGKFCKLPVMGVALACLAACVMRETYDDPGLPEGERALVVGYWHYRLLYDEELHVASVDGRRESGTGAWPYAYSVSLPSGKHWLQLVVLRNSSDIARCAIEWTFEAQHRYKLQRLDHEQFLLAHASASPFPASIAMAVTTPAGTTHTFELPAVCGKQVLCREHADCAPPRECRMTEGFAFGVCEDGEH